MKSLIIYFSHVGETIINNEIKELKEGNTKVVAEQIKNLVDGVCYEIIPVNKYPETYEECLRVAKRESREDERPEYVDNPINIKDFDVIYIGYPIWEGSFPRIVAKFLFDHDFTDKIVKPFSTHGGSTGGFSDLELKGLLKGAKIKEILALDADKVVDKNFDELVGWVYDY